MSILPTEKSDLVKVDGDKPKEVVADALYAKVLELLKTPRTSLLDCSATEFQHVNGLENRQY